MKCCVALAVSFLSGLSSFAGAWDNGNTWFVATNGVDTAASAGGGTEAAPFRTLQFAHDQAGAGDTIKLRPGVYDYETHSDDKHNNRLVVSKKLRFVSTEGRKSTAIVGQMDPTTGKEGPEAVRCVYVKSGGYDSEFHDLTFRGGAGMNGSAADTTGCPRWGGCIHVYGAKKYESTADSHRAYFIDCDIVGGAAVWGAGMYGGTAIRCLFNDNRGSSFGSTVMGSALWNCVVFGDRNSAEDRYAIGKSTVLVNCTVYGVQARGVYSESHIFNTYVDNCAGTPVLSGAVVSNCVVGSKNGDLRLMLSPATGDFRPLAGSALENGGLTKLLLDRTLVNLPADCALTDFYGNPIDTASETCHVGAVQGPAAAVGTGRVDVNPGMTADGFFVGGVRTAYAQAERFPATLALRPASPTCMRLRTAGYKKLSFLYPQYDGTVHVGYPLPSVVHSFSEIEPKATLWADPTADAGSADGTEAHPYRTLQAAMDRIVGDDMSEVVVWAKPGVYAEGGAIANGVMNRVVMPNAAVLIKSVGGADVTTIRGADDPGSTSVEFPGCGSAAIRCVTMPKLESNAAIQGFTFEGGRTDCAGGGVTQSAGDSGGGVLYYNSSKSNATTFQVLDSTFTNCCAPFNAAVHGAVCTRCRFADCVSWGGLAANTFLIGCLVEPSCKAGPKPEGADAFEMFKVNTHTVHSTVWDGVVFCGSDDQRNVFSSVFVTSEVRGNYYYYGSVFDPKGTKTTSGTGWDKKDVVFADAENGDFRLLANSPAALGGVLPKRTAAYYGVWATNYSEYVSSGLDGERIRFRDDGVPLPGCIQTCRPGTSVSVPSGGIRVTGAEAGCHPLAEDAVVTIAPDFDSATRPIVGYVLNGVTNELTDATAPRTLTADDLRTTEGFSLTALYGTDWYVDANQDDDSHSGVTPATAKRTLAAIMACVRSGDTVHAAPGRYEEGESRTVGATHPPERVAIPSGVKLVSDEGAARTFIVGRLGTDAYTDALGCGSNSMRCVSMEGNAELRGFTLTDGSAYPANGQNYAFSAPYNHGAVYAGARGTTFVCDCVVTNCAAYNAAAGREVAFVNTLITGNRATVGVTSECNLLGCVVDGNYADSATVYKFTYVFDTTLGPNAWKLNGSAGKVLGTYSTLKAGTLVNCLILGKTDTSTLWSNVVANCVFDKDKVNANLIRNVTNCFVVAADEAKIDADLRPIAGESVACDHADPSLLTPSATLDRYLLPLRQRANNGALDIGALEADWSARYARDLSRSRTFAVTSATPGVIDTGSHTLILGPGERVTAEEACGGRACDYDLRFWVAGTGTLTVTVNGESSTYVASPLGYAVTVRGGGGATDSFAFSFDGTDGYAELTEVSRRRGFVLMIGGGTGGSGGSPVPHPREVRVSRDFGYDPSDSTRFIQRALDSGAERVILDHVDEGPWYAQPLKMRSNTELVVEPDTELVAKRGAFRGLRDYLFEADGVENVTIRGGAGSVFRMWKGDYQDETQYEQGEWRYALRLHNVTNALVEGLAVRESGGDGMGISGKNIVVRNCVCDANHRQGISVFNVEGLLIENTVMSNTSGTAPQSGIDFEPDRNGWKLSDVTMRNCLFADNAGIGIQLYLSQLKSDSAPVSMRFENCRTVGNSASVSVNPGARAGNHVEGLVEFVGCTFESSRGNGISLPNKMADAFDVRFEDCVVTNAAKTSVALSVSGDDMPGQPDGIDFGNLTVFLNADKPWFKLTTQGYGPSPTRIGGTVTVVKPDGSASLETIDADWIDRNIRLVNDGESPMSRAAYPDASAVTAVDAAPGELVDLSPMSNVSDGRRYVFLMGEGGGRARFVARQVIAVDGREASTNQLTVAPLVGAKKANTVKLDIPGETAAEISFDAPAGGFYVLTVPETDTRFQLLQSSVPVALDNTKATVTVAGVTEDGKRQPFSLWFGTKANDAFQSVVKGSDYYHFAATLVDPAGNERFVRTSVEDTQMYVSDGTVPEGLWRWDFKAAPKAHYDWIGVDLLGVPGFLFLTPEKYWK